MSWSSANAASTCPAQSTCAVACHCSHPSQRALQLRAPPNLVAKLLPDPRAGVPIRHCEMNTASGTGHGGVTAFQTTAANPPILYLPRPAQPDDRDDSMHYPRLWIRASCRLTQGPAQLKPQVEQGGGIRRRATAYLSAHRPHDQDQRTN